MACDRCGSAAAERDAASSRVVTAFRLQCLDHPVVDTGVEFESPSGAPLGYDCGSPIDEARAGLAAPRTPVERRAQSGERVATHVALVSIARTTSARAEDW